jgi:hypothetical protein
MRKVKDASSAQQNAFWASILAQFPQAGFLEKSVMNMI